MGWPVYAIAICLRRLRRKGICVEPCAPAFPLVKKANAAWMWSVSALTPTETVPV